MTTRVSGSIDTSAVDAYLQGVELTQDKQFFAGVAKIWSGYPGHELPQTEFGELQIFEEDLPFEEKRKYTAIDFIQHSDQKSSYEYFTVNMLNRSRDGAMEPFNVRSGSIDGFALPIHGAKGTFGDGNTNEFGETEPLADQFVIGITGTFGPWVDSAALVRKETYRTGRLPREARLSAYADDFPYKKGLKQPASASVAVISARNAMSGTDLNTRLQNKSKSMTCGFVYDGATYGTDSLAFGGLKW